MPIMPHFFQDEPDSSKRRQESPLFIAAKHNCADMVEHLLTTSEIQSSANSEGLTPLMVALREGSTEAVKILLKHGNARKFKQVRRSLEERDNNDQNVFHHAFGSRKPAEVTHILVDVCSMYYKDFSKKMKDFLTVKDLNEDTPFHVLVQQRLEKDKFDEIFKSFRRISDISDEESLEDLLNESSAADEGDPAGYNDNRPRMSASGILKCMKEKNVIKETPLHTAAKNELKPFVEALLDLNQKTSSTVETSIEQLLTEKDENANTALHLATQTERADHGKTKEVAKVLLNYIRNNAKDPIKYLAKKNSFGWTPFSGAVAGGDQEMVKEMLDGLSEAEKRAIVNQPDFSNTFPLHLAAKHGHVGIFNILVGNHADLLERGRNHKTALDIAIEHEKRLIVQTIIQGESWKEAFKIPSTTERGDLDTPLRKLIRQLPDMAEEFLDRCCEEARSTKDAFVAEVIEMNTDFIGDTKKYRIQKTKVKKEENKFVHRDNDDKGESYIVDINNHPMVIMADEKKLDLLQHPLCIAIILKKWSMYRWYYYFTLVFYALFLTFLMLYTMSSPTPIDNPGLFNCTAFFRASSRSSSGASNSTELENVIGTNSDWNKFHRVVLMVIVGLRILIFILVQEYKPILNRLGDIEWGQVVRFKNLQAFIKLIPWVFLLDFLVFTLALYIALVNFSTVTLDGETKTVDVRGCLQWQISSITVTLAWINLLLYMRMLYGVGKYIILFQDVLLTFGAVFIVVFVLVIAFAASFLLLFSNRESFATFGDSLLKTMIMMSGEFEFADVFFKDLPPLGFGLDWDMGHENVPFPFLTYTLFVVFFFIVSIVALNVLVGLTVDDIRNFLQNADLLKLDMRLRYILAQERGHLNRFVKRWEQRKDVDEKGTTTIEIKKQNEMAVTNDLISKAKIWEKVEKKREERRRRSELDQEKRELKELIRDQTKKLKEFLSKRRRTTEKAEPGGRRKEGKVERPAIAPGLGRQTQMSSSFDFDDEIYELTLNVKEMMNVVKTWGGPQRENPEIERLQEENMRLREDNKSLTEIKNDLKVIIQHMRSEATLAPVDTTTSSSSSSSYSGSGSLII